MIDTYYMNAHELSSAISEYENALSQSSEQNNMTLNEVENFTSSSLSTLIGDVWNDIRTDVDNYTGCLVLSEKVNEIINEANKECLKMIQEFLEPDTELNTADLPQFEAERDRLEAEIAAANERIDYLQTIPATIPKTVTETDSEGKTYTHTIQVPNEPAYSAAQNEIANLNHQINSVLIPALNETNRLIDKINTFNNVVLPAVMAKLDNVENYLNDFMDKVAKINELIPKDIDARRRLDEAIKNIEDLDRQYEDMRNEKYENTTPEARFLYAYDLLKEYGYSEWGAKAMLAQMYGTTHGTMDPTTPQIDDEGKICGPAYGLTQLEWSHFEYEEDGKVYFQDGCGEADVAKAWCDKNGYNFDTIDGQIAYLAQGGLKDISQAKAAHEKDPITREKLFNLDDNLRNATKDDYEGLVENYGTAIQGTQGDQFKNSNRAKDGGFQYGFCPLINIKNSFDLTKL